jgi:predicted transcriptional regulator YdeE
LPFFQWCPSSYPVSDLFEPIVQTDSFTVMGIRIRTSNDVGAAALDIPNTYSKFYKEEIPKKLDHLRKYDPLYAIYFNYESDELGHYDFLLGYCVKDNETPILGLEKVQVPLQSGRYFSIQPGPPEDVVPKFWATIWNRKEIHFTRTFQFDWEEYSEAGIRVFLSSK